MTLKELEKKILLIDKVYHNRRCCLKVIEDIKADIIKTCKDYDKCCYCLDYDDEQGRGRCPECSKKQALMEWAGVTEKDMMKE